MTRIKRVLDKFDWYDIEATTSDTGRVYHTPVGDAPSVTTILSSIPSPELDEWRERVGIEEATRITREATDIGTLMHDSLEAFLLKEEYVPNPECNPDVHLNTALQMAKVIRLMGFRNVNEVWAVEIPLHFDTLYAGRTDLVGLYNSTAAIMDYKTSKYVKPPEQLHKYRLQLAAYAIALERMFGMRIDLGVNFFAIRPNSEFKKTAESHPVLVDEQMMTDYKYRWADLLLDYYGPSDQTKLDSISAMIDLIEAK